MANRTIIVVQETTTTRTIWREALDHEAFAVADDDGLLVPVFTDEYDDGVWVRHRHPEPPPRGDQPMFVIHPIALNIAQATPARRRRQSDWTTVGMIFLFGLLLGHLLTGI